MRQKMWILQSVFVAAALLIGSSNAEAILGLGVGARGGYGLSGTKAAIFGGQIEKSIFPMISARPTVEITKKGGVTTILPSLDLKLNINAVGVGPKPYVGAGIGIASTRVKILGTTFTSNQASYNVLGGVSLGLAPMLQAFVEVKGVFIKSTRSSRVLVGLNLAL